MRTHVSNGDAPILIFERSRRGRHGTQVHPWGPQGVGEPFMASEVGGINATPSIPTSLLRTSTVPLPEVQELELVRHYIALSREQYGIDTGFYPLGSCTMKYNPKISEALAYNPRFATVHPSQPEQTTQGFLRMLHDIQEWLTDISGMDA